MAETKRAVVPGRIATPKVSGQAQGTNDLDVELSRAIGARVKIITTHSTNLEGTLFTSCPVTKLVAINTLPTPPTPKAAQFSLQGDFHIIQIWQIESFSVLAFPKEELRSDGSGAGPDGPQPLPKVDTKALSRREKEAIEDIKKRDQARGRGVSKEGQAIYDALDRTLPTRWAGDQIVVSDAVVIKPPYTLDDCTAPRAQQTALARVRKVLEKERQKIARNGMQSVAVPASMRKGG